MGNESKHTPGPWTVQNGTVIVAGHNYRGQVADAVATGAMTHSELRANARLISAAPELLEALGQLTMALDFDDDDERVDALALARAAIAKATGGES